MLKLKLQYFGHLMRRTDSLEKTLMLGKIWGWEEKGKTEDEMVGWHHWLNKYEFEWAPGVGDGQGSLVCCSQWGLKELDMTEWLNWLTESLQRLPLLLQRSQKLIKGEISMRTAKAYLLHLLWIPLVDLFFFSGKSNCLEVMVPDSFLYDLCVCVLSHFSHVWLFVTPWTIVLQAPLYGILQAWTLGWFAMPSSRESSQTRDWTHVSHVSCIADRFFTIEQPGKPLS